jgi:Domain of unknown function (DUF5666)
MDLRRLLLTTLGAMSGSAAADDVLDIQGRRVVVGPATQIVVDDEPLPPGSPVPQKPGLRVEARFANGLGMHGAGAGDPAITVIFSYALKGPVTSVEPLSVLGQEITVTADTETAGLPGGSIDNVAVGDHLDVSGYFDTNSSVLASFVEFSPTPIARWLLGGYVTAVDTNTVDVGPQRVATAGIAAQDCGGAAQVGQFVEIRADAMAGFVPGAVLDTVTDLRCVEPVPIGTPGALGALNGVVGTILSDTSFQFGAYTVNHDAATEFRFGSADDILTGAALEVDGVFGDNLTFTAQGIQFDAPTIRLEGPAEIADVVPGSDGTVTLLDNVVRRSAQLRDEDGIYLDGITQPRQIELRGYLDRLGNRYATRARLRGAPDAGDARAGGPVEWVARPELGVLGLTLDTTGALFEDPAEQPIDEDTFFLDAVPGALVEQNGAWDAATQTITGGIALLVARVEPPPAPRPTGAGRSLIVGTLRGTDRVFANGFD